MEHVVGDHVEVMDFGDSVVVDLYYPRHNPIKHVEVSLVDVRAADSVRVSYDFDRDGWVIEQASVFSWGPDDEENDPDWQEVAFVKAWAREPQGCKGQIER